jgi:hypothetical protein
MESSLELAAHQQMLKKFTIAETPEGFYVIVQFKGADNEWYLTTRREREQPRLFKDLKRLNEHLKSICPTSRVEILRDQQLPPVGGMNGKKMAVSRNN